MEKIRVEDLTFSYDKETNAVEHVSFSIEEGSYTTIIGHNGSGKSTIAKLLIGLLDKDQGHIYVDQDELSIDTLYDIRDKVGIVFQNPDNQFIGATVADDIAFGLENHQVETEKMQPIIERFAQKVKMTEYMQSEPTKLSGGQKQRVAIARALATNPKILLCDEATSALDPQTTKSILALLKEINQKYGITIVIITHEMAVVREICTRVGIIGNGELVEHGNVIDVFSHPQSDEAKELVLRNHGENYELVESLETKNCVRIVFSENSSYEPVIANMVLKFGLPVNILKADTKNVSGIAHGEMILGLPEDRAVADEMRDYLRDRNLAVEEVTGYVG